MPVNLQQAQALAAAGTVHFNAPKAIDPVVERLDLTPAEAERFVCRLIGELTGAHFWGPGAGHPPPACDEYVLEKTTYSLASGRFETVRWYLKFGIKSAAGVLWVQSCHPEARP